MIFPSDSEIREYAALEVRTREMALRKLSMNVRRGSMNWESRFIESRSHSDRVLSSPSQSPVVSNH